VERICIKFGISECFPHDVGRRAGLRTVAYLGRGGGGLGVQPPIFRYCDNAEPNSQFRGIYIRNNLIRIRGSLIYKLSGTPDWGATAPRSLSPQLNLLKLLVSKATSYGLDGPGIESRWERDLPQLSRPALGPTQPPVQLVPGFSRG
jgi:hypothetical protein